MTPDEIARLREFDKARTQGEWRASHFDIGSYVDGSRSVAVCKSANRVNDAAYIVAACNALPRLLDELHEMRTLLKSLQWVALEDGGPFCGFCGNFALDGHKADCRLAKALQGGAVND